jgi:prolyl oligopeptidase
VKYPRAPNTAFVETLHGVPVPDPFRTLENADDPATRTWVDAENALTRQLLDTPHREQLVARLAELHRVPRASVPAVRGDRLFFTENDGTWNQAVLYVQEAGGSGLVAGETRSRRILVDPNLLDAQGTTAITVFEPDDTGDRIVYGLSLHGSDIQELLIHDVGLGSTLPDRLQWVKFASIAWWRDGFFYTRYPQPGSVPPEHEQYFCQVWFHRVGDPQAADRLVYRRADAPEIVFDVDVTPDGLHLVITSRRGASDDAEVHVVRLKPDTTCTNSADVSASSDVASDVSRTEAIPIVTGFTSGWHFVGGDGGRLYFHTDAGAPFGRIVLIDLSRPSETPAVIVAESRDTIVDAVIAGGQLIISSLRNASSRLERRSLDGGEPREIALPGLGTIVGLAGEAGRERAFITFTSFTTPPAILAIDNDRAAPIERISLPFDPEQYVTEQVWYPSKDGTAISLFLIEKKGQESGQAARRPVPFLLTGYGGFNISLTPAFDPSDFLWLDAGRAMAVANLRGGGEYGDAWHKAGMRERKQNVFDDFIAAAEWLKTSGRAAPGRIAIEGGSNGGLLVGACVVQRPDLFGAVVCRVPVADMLRYHLFTVGRFWIPEYGCADVADDFPYLHRYSPYHQVKDGVAYPPTLVMTADTDDRVAPGMAKKFAARLQDAVSAMDAGPILLRVETRAGHGAGKPIKKQIDEQADLYEFLFSYLTRTSVSEQ